MALGIDIYRYQTVTDWAAVKRHGVSWVYVKASDGGGPAIVRADGQTRGAQGIGLPVGLYHYAQFSPSPEVQADVLTAEVRRLGATGLPPALDLEDPFQPDGVARDFARRFLMRLRVNGFDTVTLYANTSMLNGIVADSIGVPNTVIWAAAYGPNDGRRHPLSYRGRVNIHQYTSVGVVPGISGRVDLNESLTQLGGGLVATPEEIKAIASATADAVWEAHRPHLDPNNGLVLPMWMWSVGANMGAWAGANRPLPSTSPQDIAAATVELIRAELRQQLADELSDVEVDVDVDAIADRTADRTVERMFKGPADTLAGTEGNSGG